MTLVLTSVCLTAAASTPPPAWNGLEGGPFEVGFRLVDEIDLARSVRADSTAGATVPRPLRIYLWYPAASATGQAAPMTFSRYAALANTDVWPASILGPARERTAFSRRPLARSLSPEDLAGLLALPVAAREGAAAAPGQFPVVVVGQGLYYESPVGQAMLCELLASHGFVVVTTPLVGTDSPLVQLNVIDLETQVRDMEAALARARQEPFASPDALAALGHDMGAMAALVLAMRNPAVDGLVTLDAAVLYGHPSGIPIDSPDYDPARLRVPWLHATQRRFGTRPEDHEGPDLFAEALAADRYLLLTEGLDHSDFTSFALIPNRRSMVAYWPTPAPDAPERYRALCRYIVGFLKASLKADPEARALLTRDPEEVAPGFGFTLEHRAAASSQPTYSDFLNTLLTGDLERARSIASTLAKAEPDGRLLDEAVLKRLGYHLMTSWQLDDEGILVLTLNTELHPESVDARNSLGKGFLLEDNLDAAAPVFRKVLEMDPENAEATLYLSRIEEAGKQHQP
jgi:dienelactone hydrolase